MTTTKRPVLSLRRRDVTPEEDEQIVTLDFFEVLLPSRKFQVSYKVAERGAVTLTSEFLLRLLHSVDGMDEIAIAEFFGFNQREMTFVMSEVTTRDYVTRSDGKVWLTPTGRALFRDGEETPQILSVNKRHDVIGFDLLSLCPQDYEQLGRFAFQLPELPVLDVQLLANATRRIPDSFRQHFPEISMARNSRFIDRQEYLYSIDGVAADRRFSAVVPVFVKSPGGRPGLAEPDLSKWRNGHELEDRGVVIEAVSAYMDKLKISKRPDDGIAYKLLADLAPDFMGNFIWKAGSTAGALAVERFYKAALTRAGELRADRPTVPILGSLFTPENNAKLNDALGYGLKLGGESLQRPNQLIWFIPQVHWGYTQALPATLTGLKRQILQGTTDESPTKEFCSIAILRDRLLKHIDNAFTRCEFLNEHATVAPAMEILWVPGLMIAALVHAPVKAQHSIPVPLGILSFDPSVVSRAEALICENLSHLNIHLA